MGVGRVRTGGKVRERASRVGLVVGVVERNVPLVLRGPVGAEILRREDGLEDDSIYLAVCWHTTGHPSLDSLGKLVFLADKLDPQKLSRYPDQPRLRELAEQDLDQAMLEFLTREIISLTSRGEMVHPAMLSARNHLLASIG